jgi:hypothetical protein
MVSRRQRYEADRLPARYTIWHGRASRDTDPVIEVFKKDVDRTLLRENLRLTPEQRLRKLQSALRGILALRETRELGS